LDIKNSVVTKNYGSFEVQKQVMLEYLQVAIAIEDWHGVSDIANDLRELEAKNTPNYKSN
jgi:hypothetical protein